jgi:ABC-type multidrug transport system ATPase subunit
MEDVSKGGRTVLFVSHNLKAVSHMCTKALLLRSGQAAHKLEDVASAIRSYTEGTGSTAASEWVNSGSLFTDPRFTPRLTMGFREYKSRHCSVAKAKDVESSPHEDIAKP